MFQRRKLLLGKLTYYKVEIWRFRILSLMWIMNRCTSFNIAWNLAWIMLSCDLIRLKFDRLSVTFFLFLFFLSALLMYKIKIYSSQKLFFKILNFYWVVAQKSKINKPLSVSDILSYSALLILTCLWRRQLFILNLLMMEHVYFVSYMFLVVLYHWWKMWSCQLNHCQIYLNLGLICV